MSTKSKARGTRAESEVVKYLQNWWPAAERRALSGNKDKGDVAGIPGLVVEVKAARTQDLAAWKRETLKEEENAEAVASILVVKRPFKPVGQWDAYLPPHLAGAMAYFPEGVRWLRMDLTLAVELLRKHGLLYPSPPSSPTTESS